MQSPVGVPLRTSPKVSTSPHRLGDAVAGGVTPWA